MNRFLFNVRKRMTVQFSNDIIFGKDIDRFKFVSEVQKMKIELKKWSFEDKEFLIKMCNTVDRSYLSDRLPNPYTNESAEWWLNMVKENDEKRGVFREIVVDGKIIGTISNIISTLIGRKKGNDEDE